VGKAGASVELAPNRRLSRQAPWLVTSIVMMAVCSIVAVGKCPVEVQ